MGTWIALNCWSGHSRAALDLRWEMRGIWPVLLLHHVRFYVAPVYPLFLVDARLMAFYLQSKERSLIEDPARALQESYATIYENHREEEIPFYKLCPLQVHGG